MTSSESKTVAFKKGNQLKVIVGFLNQFFNQFWFEEGHNTQLKDVKVIMKYNIKGRLWSATTDR